MCSNNMPFPSLERLLLPVATQLTPKGGTVTCVLWSYSSPWQDENDARQT